MILAACGKHILQAFLAWAYSYTSISQQEGSPPPCHEKTRDLAPLPLAIITDGKEVRVAHAGLGSCAASQGPLLAASCSIASLSPCSARPVWIASYTSRVAAALPHSTWSGKGMCLCVRESMTSI